MKCNRSWLMVFWLILLIQAGCNQGDALEIYPVISPLPSSTQTGELEVRDPKAIHLPVIDVFEESIVLDETPLHSPTLDPFQQSMTSAAIENLAIRFGIAPQEIQLIEVEADEWPDASLGCPQSGMVYAQVLTPGFMVRLAARGQTFEYHTDMEQNVVLCDSSVEETNSNKETDKNVEDGWPNQTKDDDVIISSPTK